MVRVVKPIYKRRKKQPAKPRARGMRCEIGGGAEGSVFCGCGLFLLRKVDGKDKLGKSS